MAGRPAKKKLVAFKCFHCPEEVKIEAAGVTDIDRVYCKKCEALHKSKVSSPAVAREYMKYLRKIQKRVPNRKDVKAPKNLLLKDDHLFEIESGLDLGPVDETCCDKNWIGVVKNIGDTPRLFRRECVIEQRT